MTKNLYWLVEVTINDGKHAAFEALMAKLIAQTQDEAGTLAYEWWIGADKKRCWVYERYADSDAVMAHLANVGPLLPELMAVASMGQITVHGPASDQVKAAFADFAPTYTTQIGGFVR